MATERVSIIPIPREEVSIKISTPWTLYSSTCVSSASSVDLVSAYRI